MSLFSGITGKIAKAALALGTAGWLSQSALYTVPPGHRAVLYDHVKGVRSTVHGEGTHLLVPILQYPIVMDVRTRPRTIRSVTSTKDLQQVNLSLRILSRPQPEKIKAIYQKIGTDFDERILPSIGNEVLKAVVAQYNADQLLTLRTQVSDDIREALAQRAAEFHLVLDDVSITDLAFSREFSNAIEHKQIAQQQAERAKFVVQKAEQQKAARIIQAEGDADAALLVSQAMAKYGRGLLEIRRIETALAVSEALAASGRVTYLPSGAAGGAAGGPTMLLNLPADRA